MTLQQLRYFCVMAKVLHYTKAAGMLYISQPSLSHALAEMERELGVPLFEKSGKKTFLTRYGAGFLPYAQNAIMAISEGEAAMAQMADPKRGRISLGYIYSLSYGLLPSLVERFLSFRGDSNINFNFTQNMTSKLLDMLSEGALDFVFAERPANDSIEAVPVLMQEMFLVVSTSHRLAGRSSIDLDEIADELFISINPNTSLRALIDGCFKRAGISPKTVMEADECNSMAAFVNAGLGIAIMPHISSLCSYNVSVIPIANSGLRREICLLWKKDRQMPPSAEIFKNFVERENPPTSCKP